MIKFIKRDKNDIFGMSILKIIFKNKIFHRTVQSICTFFIYLCHLFWIYTSYKRE